MKFVSLTLQYLKKSFPLLIIAGIVPAALLGFLSRPFSMLTFLPVYAETEVSGYIDILKLVFDERMFWFGLPILGVFILLVLSLSICISIIEKHFRTGRLMLKAPLRDINNSVVCVFVSVLTMTIGYLLVSFLSASMATLIQYFFGVWGIPSPACVTVSAIAAAALFVVFAYLVSTVFLWSPVMLIFGHRFLDGVLASASFASGKARQLLTGVLFPVGVVLLIVFPVVIISPPYIVSSIIYSVCFLFLIIYYAAFAMTATFELSNLERRDLKRLY